MRSLLVILALSSAAIVPTTVSAQQQTCAPREDVAKAVESGRLRLMAQALDGRGNLLQFLMKPSDLSWAAWVTVPGSPDSCAAFGGPAWLDEPPPPVVSIQRPPVGERGTTNVPAIVVPIEGGVDS